MVAYENLNRFATLDQTGGDNNIYNLPTAARLALALSRRSPIHLPDAVGWTPLNADAVVGVGTEISLKSKIYIKNGTDRGTSINVRLDIGTAFGWDQGISGVRTEYYFFGNYDSFNAGDFLGNRLNLSVGGSFGVEVGYGISYMNVNGGVIIGVSKHLGFSPPGLSGNFNIGESHDW